VAVEVLEEEVEAGEEDHLDEALAAEEALAVVEEEDEAGSKNLVLCCTMAVGYIVINIIQIHVTIVNQQIFYFFHFISQKDILV
jgi:hypothetical protein